MLEIKKVTKIYETDGFRQKALDDVSINFRKNEFASILGQSGSGKTTLLNIIGGLDRYTSGDLIINKKSTKKFEDRDWDSYRNHRVGFVFQNYNLIGHQSILSNVELALTLSGVSKKERNKRAKDALRQVGLEKHMMKKPNQLSGGQMQRVAIARALVNNPDILLADEPTGALDSETSIQIMDILKEVARNRLVIMVTHNPDLAHEYATRIIKLKDGKIIDDSNPYNGIENDDEELEVSKNKTKKTSMNLRTALSLSLNNLMTKKGRTILTAFAGSIGIIGIALILALSEGVQGYIDKTQKEALSSYPISIEKTSVDVSNIISKVGIVSYDEVECKNKNICTFDDITQSREYAESLSVNKNNLVEFKKYLDNNGGKINDYVTDVKYSYDLNLQIYSNNTNDGITRVNPNTLTLTKDGRSEHKHEGSPFASMVNSTSSNVFSELIDNDDLLNNQYNIIAGRMPKEYNEIVLVTNSDEQLPLSVMYSLDIENRDKLLKTLRNSDSNTLKLGSINYDYNSLLNKTFKLILNTDYYEKDNNYWKNMSNDTDYMRKIIKKGLDLKIVGVISVTSDDMASGFVGYRHSLTKYVINNINNKEITKEQLNNKEINVLTGNEFDGELSKYETTLSLLGITNINEPIKIDIYPKNFESKDEIGDIIKDYNDLQTKQNKDENTITYTDMIGVLLSSVTSIVNVISYVLIAFVAVSLIVSSIMIAIITYISVLERTKEIGILRAIGASKKDISRVFNAETIIEGLVAGLLGVGIAYLLTIPINLVVENMLEISNIASLSILYGIALIIISILLTLIAGFIPARMASKKDLVESLRSE